MEQTEGLCAPGSATTTTYVTITVEPQSSQFVTFSVVPMITGAIPIKIRLFSIDHALGIDAIEKTLNVLVSNNSICSVCARHNTFVPQIDIILDRLNSTVTWLLFGIILTLQTEGVQKTDEETRAYRLDGKCSIH